jgi:hypothetical protein
MELKKRIRHLKKIILHCNNKKLIKIYKSHICFLESELNKLEV